jgi:3-dehydroquinate synthase
LLAGLQEFQEHLGGKLTIMLLKKIGSGVEVNKIDRELMIKAIGILKNFSESSTTKKLKLNFH